MKKTLYIIGVLIPIFFGIISCEEDEIDLYGDMEGIVTNADTNEPIQGVLVTLDPTNTSKTTGSDGHFVFEELDPKEYTIQCSKTGFETNTKTATIEPGMSRSLDISLNPIEPIIETSVTSLDFGDDLTSLPVSITNSGQGTLEWSISEDVNWITINPLSGSTTTEISNIVISIDRSGLAQGNYNQSISILSNGGNITISITMVVSEGPLMVSPLNLSFANEDDVKELYITNSGSSSISYSITSSISWVTVTPISGSIYNETDVINISADRTGVAYGTYDGTIIINSDENTIIINMQIIVADPDASIISLSGDLNFGEVELGSSITKTLTISNTGNSDFNVSSITNPSGYSSGFSGTISPDGSEDITITFTPTTEGNYDGLIVVNSDADYGLNEINCYGSGIDNSVTGTLKVVNNINWARHFRIKKQTDSDYDDYIVIPANETSYYYNLDVGVYNYQSDNSSYFTSASNYYSSGQVNITNGSTTTHNINL